MAEEGQVIYCHSKNEWDDHFQKGKDSKQLVVVDFTAAWCGPCRIIAPAFDELAKNTPNVLFLKVDIDELLDVSTEWKIRSVPTFLFIKEGKLVDSFSGANKVQIGMLVAKHSAVADA
ncbi:thioredoxin H1-like [Humulus lupulus]|uniref:thioredoxin H1-like n=1 Tax=Humulus lupulus TaxID=3486 RepID=UPI002B406B23|nr:thioredoxin H1-like [Humulus lupulus]